MRNTIAVIAVLSAALFSLPLSAQEISEIPEGYELVDSLVYRPVEAVDTTLAGRDIFMMMPVSAGDDVPGMEAECGRGMAELRGACRAADPLCQGDGLQLY